MPQSIQTHESDVITLKDVAVRIPGLLKKLPHVVKGLVIANNTSRTKPMGFGLSFEQAVERNPQGYAVLYQDVRITYADFNGWVNQLAHYFLSKGLKKGDVAAVFVENRPELLATVLAMAKLGVTSALVNTSQTGKVLVHSINLVKPKVVVVGEELFMQFNDIQTQLTTLTLAPYWLANTNTLVDAGMAPEGYQNLALEIKAYPRFNPYTTANVFYADGLFYIYTSGTTGLPKAVVFTNGRWMKAYGTFGHIMNLGPTDVLYVTLPLYHATGMVIGWSCAIAGGAGFAVRRKFSAREFWTDVIKYNATGIVYVGELCRYLMELPVSATDSAHRVTKMIGNGMRPNIWGKFKSRFGVDEFLEFYASSEGNVGFSNVFNFDNTVGFSPTPYAVVEYDKENNQPVRNSKGYMIKVAKGGTGLLIGEITKRAPFDGYTDPEKNKAVVFTDVFKKGDAYFNTGDLVRDIGFRHAQFVDRVGDTFRWKGENVSTCEVENLVSEHTKISEAVVYGVEIPETNGRAGMAAITLHDDQVLTADDFGTMLDFFKASIPAYAIPVFLRIQQRMETTGTFKYQKNTLKEQGYNPSIVVDPLWVWLPGASAYSVVDKDVFAKINAGKYRF